MDKIDAKKLPCTGPRLHAILKVLGNKSVGKCRRPEVWADGVVRQIGAGKMSEGLRPAHMAFKVVTDVPEPALPKGKALVFGHFPPVSTPSSQAAAGELWLLDAAGYQVRSATGPGLSLAAQNVNFTSETRFRASTAFLDRQMGKGLAVVHARALEFARIAKPTWYKRRMEELRRMRLLARIVSKHQHTALILDGRPLLSRESLALVLGAVAGALAGRKRLSLVRRNQGATGVFERLTGLIAAPPGVHQAEERAYRAAFEGAGLQAIRLTAPRAEQIVRFAAGKSECRRSAALVEDVVLLSEIAQRHDLRDAPVFRLVDAAGPLPAQNGAVPQGAGARAAADRAGDHGFEVPLTRYMSHLREAFGLQKKFPLVTRAQARQFLNWYLREAPPQMPGNWVPVTAEMRQFLRSEAGLEPARAGGGNLTHMHGHSARPFALSEGLTALYLANPVYQASFDIDDPVDRIGFVVRALVEAEDGVDPAALIGPQAVNWLMAPVGGSHGHLPRLVFLMGLQARFELSGQDEIDAPWSSEAIADWARVILSDRLPALGRLVAPKPTGAHHDSKPRDVPSVRLIGLPKSGTGVGNNLLMSRAAFRHLGMEPEVWDVAEGMKLDGASTNGGGRAGLAIGPVRPAQYGALDRPLVLHHVNADRIPQNMASLQLGAARDAAHIGFLLWEFGVLPKAHQLALDMLDEVWAPSRFVAESYERLGHLPVVNMGKAIVIPQVAKMDLGRFGVAEGSRSFLTCFDFHSSVQRKNPLAVVEAFGEAFPKRRDVHLIVKTTPPAAGHWGDGGGQWARIEALAARDSRITICTERMAFGELISLVGSVDCLVSAHRAEGFGLLPAYALAQATPVIATDYSGTRDFCSPATAIPIPYTLVPVAQRDALFPMTGAQWAQIDQAALVMAMMAFADDPMEGRMRAARGRKLIAQEYSVQRQAERYARRLAALGLLEPTAWSAAASEPDRDALRGA